MWERRCGPPREGLARTLSLTRPPLFHQRAAKRSVLRGGGKTRRFSAVPLRAVLFSAGRRDGGAGFQVVCEKLVFGDDVVQQPILEEGELLVERGGLMAAFEASLKTRQDGPQMGMLAQVLAAARIGGAANGALFMPEMRVAGRQQGLAAAFDIAPARDQRVEQGANAQHQAVMVFVHEGQTRDRDRKPAFLHQDGPRICRGLRVIQSCLHRR